MQEEYAIRRYEQAAALLPMRWQRLARQLPDWQKARAEELRLRAGRAMTVLVPEGEVPVSGETPQAVVTQTDLEQLCDGVTGYSRYAAADTLSRGYLTARGGFYTDDPMEMGSRYLDALHTFFGFDRYHCVAADGMDVAGFDGKASLEEACKKAEALAASL